MSKKQLHPWGQENKLLPKGLTDQIGKLSFKQLLILNRFIAIWIIEAHKLDVIRELCGIAPIDMSDDKYQELKKHFEKISDMPED